jgi:NADH-quinone oxidoreductase subunit L
MFASLAPLIILLPLVGALVIGLTGFLSPAFRKNESLIGIIGTLAVAIPFVVVAGIFLTYNGSPVTFEIMPWMQTMNLRVGFGYNLDSLSITMALIVTGVGSVIHLYSAGYMHGDSGYYKFFLYLNLFIFSMNNLILGDNLVVTFLGWEGVGACSYFLIGFWFKDMDKAAAAQKAFVANRIGDFAFLIAIFLLFGAVGSLRYADILSAQIPPDTGWWVALLIFIAATGKSAQIPLYVWLPDAMAGPTPVSALIHAATMVTSGIYLISRLSVIYLGAPDIMIVVSMIGGLTAIVAATIALAQNDIKKVLAYSTVSQLGFMFMALGAGAFSTAIFHVMTHAFFKACLFLGSGSVIHAMEHAHAAHDPQDIRTMGGLRKYMPSTAWTFWIATVAIAGLPPLSGFFSKDEILGKVFAAGHQSTLYYAVWGVGVLTAFLTAFYMTRVTFLTFEGSERYESHAHHPHESSPLMTIPLWILAALAFVGGYVGLPAVIAHGHWNLITPWLAPENHSVIVNRELHADLATEWMLIGLSIGIAAIGVLAAFSLYRRFDLAGDDRVKKLLGGYYRTLENKYYVDEFYNRVLIRPFVWLADKAVMGFDRRVIDGVVDGTGLATAFSGDILRRLQSGLVQNYALIMIAGIVMLLAYLIHG